MKLTPEKNALYIIQTRLSEIPIAFRSLVCKDNDWSIPTFYRKFRFYKGKEILMIRLSPSETKSIISQALVTFNDLGEFLKESSSTVGIDFMEETKLLWDANKIIKKK
ncbi:hypothetical protein [Chitinophaga silvisoli]|uniref:Uncharacterized protein n=1 Tax=Chitinophaga silvisoli TaxID=2291814 RepID=A0A3E1PA21_9BACT|nr:hypothetical protein [Chitinophaga silvisoli]RFM37045.1 hypothetical protein DXN04_05980 [Chitinophaga silvisoli]